MTTRLRTWAATGQYTEDGPAAPARPAARRSAWRENAPLAVLVPVGVVVGALLAVAFMARLLAALFTRSGGARVPGEG